MEPNAINDPTWFEYLGLITDLLKSVAWPVAAIVIAALFRSDLRTLLLRLRRAGPSGVEFDSSAQRRSAQNISAANPEGLEALPGIERTVAMTVVEKKLRNDLKAFDSDKHLDVALSALARSRLDTHFALVYNTIFGSQIVALKLLHQRNGNVSMKEAIEYFDDVKSKNDVFLDWSFDQYTNFLKLGFLIEEREGKILLTDIGVEFLSFLHRYRLSENKPF